MILFSTCRSQEPKPISEAELRALIKTSLSKEHKAANEAVEKLSELTVRDLPILGVIAKKGTTCERMKAAQAIVDLNKENKTLIPVLVELSTTGNEFSSEEELLCRRGATFLLAFSSDGIRVLTDMLKHGKNLFIRRSAIFAFDELTETGNYPEGGLEAMKAAIPIIAESRKLQDQVMENMSNEVLWQIVRQGDKDLSKIAKQFVSNDPR
jgi:hypothetical protein